MARAPRILEVGGTLNPRLRATTRLAGMVLLAAGTASADDAVVRLRQIETSPGAYLTPDVRTHPDPTGAGSVLRSSDGTTRRFDGRSIHFSGGTLLALSASGAGVEAVLLDGAGRFLRREPLPAGTKATAFGSSLVAYRPAAHEPGFPYDLRLLAGSGGKRIVRPARTIVDLKPIEQHLIVASVRNGEAFPIEVEMLDAAGDARWTLTTDRISTRCVVDGDRAVALSSDRRGSELHLFDDRGSPRAVLALDGKTLTDAAFVDGGTELLVWGRRHATLVDADRGTSLWDADLPTGERLLGNGTSFVSIVSGVLALPSRRELPDGGFVSSLLLVDPGDGRVSESLRLRQGHEMPTATRRFASTDGERFVFADGVFVLSPIPEPEP